MAMMQNDKKWEEMIAMVDKDGDGKVSLDEFEAAF